jgi:2-phosphosulfolactate phosphatase
MDIRIHEFVDGAKRATGVTVIIDVFRAFTTACYAFDSGASRVIATGSVESAFELKKKYRNSVLAGERDERKIEGFDFGNSPTELIKASLAGTTVILTTTAGTNGLVNATGADILLAGSLVNAGATAKYILSQKPSSVSLVAMGYRAMISADEDILCAKMISDILKGGNHDFTERLQELRTTSGSRFFNPLNIDFSPPTDFFLCTMTDRFDFALRAEKMSDGNINLIKTEI